MTPVLQPHARPAPSWLTLVRWAALVCVLALAVWVPSVHPAALAVWSLANALLVLAAWLASLFQLRSVLHAMGAAWRWTIPLALVGTLAGFAWLERYLAEQFLFRLPSSLVFAGILLVFCLLLAPLLLAGLTGAATGILLRPRGDDPRAAARLGVSAWWTAFLGIGLLSGVFAGFGAPEAWTAGIFTGLPVFQGYLCRLLRHSRLDPKQLLHAILAALARRLVWRRGRAGGSWALDLRGAVLGLAAAGAAVLVGATAILVPTQAGALVSLIRVRNQPLFAGGFSLYEMDRLFKTNQPALRDPGAIVLLSMDPPVRRKVLTESSEAAIQATLIRQLRQWGAARVVLPQPVLEKDQMAEFRDDLQPMPDSAATRRTARDLPILASAMRAAGNVVLAVRDLRDPRQLRGRRPGGRETGISRLPGPLGSVAREIASAEVSSYGQAGLPALEVGKPGPIELPILLASVSRGVAPRVSPTPARDAVEVGGVRLPLVGPGKVLVDYAAPEPGRAFPRVSYSQVLSGEAVYVPGSASGLPALGPGGEAGAARPLSPAEERGGTWVSPSQFFRDKIVFLDSPADPVRDTPIGTMPLSELLANATATLLRGDPIHGPNPAAALAATLLLGVAVGWKCTRRDPFHAGWQTALVVMAVLAATAFAFLEGNLWIDPVVPLLGTLASYALVTQMTFTLERQERERNRALLQRFVAPEIVEELLDAPEETLGLGGRRRQVSILFADVRGFTQFAERHTPEEVLGVINDYLTAMTEALFDHRGLLDKYTGDGLMALFPVTTSPESDVSRAVRGALAMRDAAEAVSARLIAEGRPPLAIGIGVHFGEAVIGLVGNPNRFDFTALGHSVVVGARLQRLAGGGEVVVSERVYALASGTLKDLHPEPVSGEGILEAVRPYRISPGPRAALPDGVPAQPV